VGAVPVRVWATTYYPEEGFPRGARTASGYGCSERVAAANLIPRYAFVWTPATGIRQVLDTGARRNDAIAQRRYGAEFWVDFWEPRRGLLFGDDNAYVRTVWVIERRAAEAEVERLTAEVERLRMTAAAMNSADREGAASDD